MTDVEASSFYWKNWRPEPWTYIPFNGGPRICVGQQLALTSMGYVIARIVQNFDRLKSFMPEPTLKAEIVLVNVHSWGVKQD